MSEKTKRKIGCTMCDGSGDDPRTCPYCNDTEFCKSSPDCKHDWDDTYHCPIKNKPLTICIFCGVDSDGEYHAMLTEEQ